MQGAEPPEAQVDQRFQILSLDGGGIRGLYPAAVLAGLETLLAKPIVDYFDLIVGTSTGGLVASAWARAFRHVRSCSSTSMTAARSLGIPAGS